MDLSGVGVGLLDVLLGLGWLDSWVGCGLVGVSAVGVRLGGLLV